MPVTQTHQGLGGFKVALRSGGPSDEFVARVQPWDHIVVAPKGLGPEPSYTSLRETAVFVGRIDELEMDGGAVTLSGPSNAVWMGDERGNGPVATTSFTGAATVASWLGSGSVFASLLANGGLSLGTFNNLQTTNITFAREGYKTARQYLGELQELCDIPFEWYVNPNGTVDLEGFVGGFNAGNPVPVVLADLIPAWYPYVMVGDRFGRTEGFSRVDSFDRQLQVFPGEISVTWDFSGFATRAYAIGNNSPATVRNNAKPFLGETPGRFDLGALQWDVSVDGQTDVTGQLDALARTTAQYASIRREWQVSGGSAEVAFHLKPGDFIWLHAEDLPGLGSLTYAQEQYEWAGVDANTDPTTFRFSDAAFVNVAGRTVHPVRARVSQIEWPVTDRWHDVYWVSTWDRTGDVTLLNPWLDWDPDGPARLDCNANKPRWQLLVPTAQTATSKFWQTFANVVAARRRL